MTDPDSPSCCHPILRAAAATGAAALFYAPVVGAEELANSSTGIPVEYLFGTIATLVGIVYVDLKREVRSLHREGRARTQQISRMRDAVRDICHRMKINFTDHEDDFK